MTQVVHKVAELINRLEPGRMRQRTLGLVPTMGALHDGHLSLIAEARRHAQAIVVSVFVNPIQFNRSDDYDRYPRTFENDLRVCGEAGVDYIFAPDVQEMYPATPATYVEVPSLAEHLCGRFRPGHFRGVATVVMKLFQIVRPDFACFGEKDAQQLAVIRRMVKDLNVPVEIVPVPTVREPDGLALSSRNRRLGTEERSIAPLLYRALQLAAEEIRNGAVSAHEIRTKATAFLGAEPRIETEYLELVDPDEMQPIDPIHQPVLIAIAAWLGGVRLIDNLLVRS